MHIIHTSHPPPGFTRFPFPSRFYAGDAKEWAVEKEGGGFYGGNVNYCTVQSCTYKYGHYYCAGAYSFHQSSFRSPLFPLASLMSENSMHRVDAAGTQHTHLQLLYLLSFSYIPYMANSIFAIIYYYYCARLRPTQ